MPLPPDGQLARPKSEPALAFDPDEERRAPNEEKSQDF
jgi:hypothetical protein